ncbi:hypothetical protein B0H11DRAFT_1907512 [Mycena galericulata]|nr:hypothetical protein B0H11DRAFT_1924660 [Mycena galericulata]KAJ7502015.1 hypothetical protein B0H11DRAFT_1907512 [Mycena galericulata]
MLCELGICAKTNREMCFPTQHQRWVPNPSRSRSQAQPDETVGLRASVKTEALPKQWKMRQWLQRQNPKPNNSTKTSKTHYLTAPRPDHTLRELPRDDRNDENIQQ